MKTALVLPFVALLVGCPSPPDDARTGPGAGGNPPPQANNAGGPPPNGGAPPSGGAAPTDGGPDGATPAPAGDAPPADGAAPEAGADAAAEGEDGPKRAEPKVGYGPGHDSRNPGGRSVVTRVVDGETERDDGNFDQERVRALDASEYVVFSGEAKCDGCKGNLVLRAVPYFPPNGSPPENVPPVTAHLVMEKAGDFEFAIPHRGVNVVLELLVDGNKDGLATKGERFAVLEFRGGLSTEKPMGGLVIDASTEVAKLDSTDPLVPGEPISPSEATEE